MAEKKSWKETTFKQAKELEALEAKVKRSSTLHSELSQTADQYLAERTELEGEVSDLESQVSSSSRLFRFTLPCMLHLA